MGSLLLKEFKAMWQQTWLNLNKHLLQQTLLQFLPFRQLGLGLGNNIVN